MPRPSACDRPAADRPRGATRAAFPEGAHQAFDAIRPGHFWFETRRTILRDVLRSLRISADASSIEIGCGDGHLLPILPGRLRVGADLEFGDLVRAREVAAVVLAAGDRLPFHRRFRLVCAFDVIEHCEDDRAVLRACAELLEPGGRLVLTVPAGPELWSHLDEYAGHYRRYRRGAIRACVEAAGFSIERLFPLFRFLWPLALVNARLARGRRVRDPAAEYAVGRLANSVLRGLLAWEWKILGRSALGWGTSWCVVARLGGDRSPPARPFRGDPGGGPGAAERFAGERCSSR